MQYVECKNIYVILFTKAYLCNILDSTTKQKRLPLYQSKQPHQSKKGKGIIT